MYKTLTVGGGVYLGTPTALMGEIYFGTSNVYGIPHDTEYIADYLSGLQIDGSIEGAVDGFGFFGLSKGFSADINETGEFVRIPGAGLMYTDETAIEIGWNEVPNAFEVGIQGGMSQTFIEEVIPLW